MLRRTLAATGLAAAALLAAGTLLPARVAPVRDKEQGPLDKFRFVAFDGFDGKPGLNWQPVRHDESHVSYKKHPGQLTIVTQKGTIHGEADKGNPALSAKNLYVTDNPIARDGDFTVTTCVVGFKPTANYHQAGLILYDDDDNYLKLTYEFNSPKQEGVYVVVVNEQEAQPRHQPAELEQGAERVWLRLTKKGTKYDFASSTDGERFTTHGTSEWGKTGPRKVGLVAKNGGEAAVAELDARFEFFELKAP
jgi:regulation of enolase protein 1 (concanavalin A-like superfamily)